MNHKEQQFWFALGLVNGSLSDPEVFASVAAELAMRTPEVRETLGNLQNVGLLLERLLRPYGPWRLPEPAETLEMEAE